MTKPPNVTDIGVHKVLDNNTLNLALSELALRIEALIYETHKMASVPIFVSQRTALWGHYQGKIFGRKALSFPIEYKALSKLSPMTGIDFFNIERTQAKLIKSVCDKSEGECLFIDAGLVPFDMKQDFYDDFHNTPAGSKRLGNFICSKLKSLT